MFKPLINIAIVLLFSAAIIWAGVNNSVSYEGYSLFFICACVGFILHWLAFIPAYIFQTEHYFDLIGSISYVSSIALAAFLHPSLDGRGIVLCLIISFWAVRLGSFLLMRVKKAGFDRRFTKMKTQLLPFLFTWTLGGAWVFVTMAAGLAAITSTQQVPLDGYFFVGLLLWITGMTVEVVADNQKTAFRSRPENANAFINTGLWSVSRHPNYFGEIVLWLGVAVIAWPVLSGWQLATLISPIFVVVLLVKISGVRLLEIDGKRRWGSDPTYQNYVASTPVLVPYVGKVGESN